MIKKTKVLKETVERHKYCDVCDQEIICSLACCVATCSYCRKDLCDKCVGHEEDYGSDYRTVWCKSCWAYLTEMTIVQK